MLASRIGLSLSSKPLRMGSSARVLMCGRRSSSNVTSPFSTSCNKSTAVRSFVSDAVHVNVFSSYRGESGSKFRRPAEPRNTASSRGFSKVSDTLDNDLETFLLTLFIHHHKCSTSELLLGITPFADVRFEDFVEVVHSEQRMQAFATGRCDRTGRTLLTCAIESHLGQKLSKTMFEFNIVWP